MTAVLMLMENFTETFFSFQQLSQSARSHGLTFNCWVLNNYSECSGPVLYVKCLETAYVVNWCYINKIDLTACSSHRQRQEQVVEQTRISIYKLSLRAAGVKAKFMHLC